MAEGTTQRQGTPRPRSEGASGVSHPLGAKGTEEPEPQAKTPDTSSRSAPSPAPEPENDQEPGGPRPLKQGHGNYAILRLSENDHKLLRRALKYWKTEARGTREGALAEALEQQLFEGL